MLLRRSMCSDQPQTRKFRNARGASAFSMSKLSIRAGWSCSMVVTLSYLLCVGASRDPDYIHDLALDREIIWHEDRVLLVAIPPERAPGGFCSALHRCYAPCEQGVLSAVGISAPCTGRYHAVDKWMLCNFIQRYIQNIVCHVISTTTSGCDMSSAHGESRNSYPFQLCSRSLE